MDKPTIDFYNLHAKEQAALYESADMSIMYHRIEALLPPHARILEIGCGSGRDARALANMGFSVVATDASEGMIREAKRLSEGNRASLGFTCLAFPLPENHPLLLEQFDLVLVVAVIMHFSPEDRKKLLDQISRVLKPTGCFYCSFKNQTTIDKRLYQPITPLDLNNESTGVGLINCLQESNQDILGRKTLWTTMLFKKVIARA